MKIMLGMNLLNVVGNAVFIYGLDMETAGAAWSTLFSRSLSAVLVCFCLFRARLPFMQVLKPVPDSEERYREEAWRGLGSGNPAWIGSSPGAGSGQKFRKGKKKIADASILGKILKVGFPYGFENCMFYMGRILVLGMVASFGTSSIAANSVAGSIVLFQVLPGMAIVAGMPVVIARCVGAGDYAQAKFYNRKIKYTTEGTTRRGAAAYRMISAGYANGFIKHGGRYEKIDRPRLMPETIYEICDRQGRDPKQMLRNYGWIL